jgi:hypothetical protein
MLLLLRKVAELCKTRHARHNASKQARNEQASEQVKNREMNKQASK